MGGAWTRRDVGRPTLRVTQKLAEVNGDPSVGPPKPDAGRRTGRIPTFVGQPA